MRIVLSNHSLFRLGGSETWVRTMFDELSKEHEVHFYSPIHHLWKDMPPFNPSLRYDRAFVNHSNCMEYLRDKDIERIVHTSHGVIPAVEWPIPGADVYVSVSEEVREHNLAKWGQDSVVIRNPIDTVKFTPAHPTSETLKKVLFLSNYGWGVMETMEGVGFDYLHIGGEDRIEDTWTWINWADLVVGLGRSAYEAMSCGRNVVVFDYMGADGFVTPESILEYRKRNCSGRTNRIMYTAQQLHDELGRYDQSLGPRLREYILENNNVVGIAERYLSL